MPASTSSFDPYSLGANLVSTVVGGFLGQDAADEMEEAYRLQGQGAAEGSRQAIDTYGDYLRTIEGLNAPGVAAYGDALPLINTILTTGRVPTKVTTKWDDFIKRKTAQLESAQSTLGRKKQRYSSADPHMRGYLDENMPVWEKKIADLRKEIADAQKKRAAAVKAGGSMSIDDWMSQVDPGYRFRFDEGARALMAKQSAGKDRFSGRAIREATRYGQNFASSEFDNTMNRLFRLAGAGDTAVGRVGSAAAGAATGTANAQMGAATAWGQSEVNAANASAQGTMNWANALNSGVENALYDRYRRGG